MAGVDQKQDFVAHPSGSVAGFQFLSAGRYRQRRSLGHLQNNSPRIRFDKHGPEIKIRSWDILYSKEHLKLRAPGPLNASDADPSTSRDLAPNSIPFLCVGLTFIARS